MSFQQPQEPVTDAKTLYQAVCKVLKEPEVTSIQYLWDADDIWAEPETSSPSVEAVLQDAGRFLRKAITGCPPAVRTSARWTGAKLSLEPDMDELFRDRFGISTHDVETLLTNPNLLAAEDRTLYDAIERDLNQAKQRVEQDLESVWDTTRKALAPMGFELEDTNQSNLKYAVPRT